MQNKKQISINIVMNIASYAITLAITFFLTPYLIKTLGLEAYGFFPLANHTISYFMLITVAINSMANRFIAVAYHRGDYNKAQVYFNTVLFADIIIAVILFIIGIVVILFLDRIINIPIYLILKVKILFLLIFLSSMIVLSLSIFKTCIYVKNRIDIDAYINIAKPIIRGIVLLILFSAFSPNLVYIGIAALVIFTFEAVSFVFVKKKILPDIQIGKKYFNKSNLFELAASGGWNVLSRINDIMYIGLDLLIANIILGPAASGILALSKSLPMHIISLTNIINKSFIPSLTKTFANNEDRLMDEMKISFIPLLLVGSIILGGIISVCDLFYNLWVPAQDSTQLSILTISAIAYFIIGYGYRSALSIFVLKNQLKVVTLVNTLTALCTLIIVLILLKFTSLGIYAITGTSSLLILIQTLAFTNWHLAKLLKQKWYIFYLYSLKSLLCIGIVIGIGLVVRNILTIDSWLMLGFGAVIIACISFAVNLFIVTKKGQRKFLFDKILEFMKLR